MTKHEDTGLRNQVLRELDWDSRVDTSEIAVTASDGEVTLAGHVPSYAQLYAASRTAQRVAGVRALANELDVQLEDEAERDDEAIARSVAHVLESNTTPAERGVRAAVRGGVVTLEGEVEWHQQRRHVEKQVAHVGGVRSILNAIVIRPRPVPEDVKGRIEAALARNAELESDGVTVTVDGHTVTLEGNVKAFYERNIVEFAAWSAPGVTRVVDHISVG